MPKLRYITALIVSFVLMMLSHTQASAAADFATAFKSTYTISDSDTVEVSHEIEITNLTSHLYLTNYSVATSGQNIAYINASDESGPLSTQTITQGGITSIQLDIAHATIGINKVKKINLNYTTHNVVEVIGDTKTINIPRLDKANEAVSYQRIVKIKNLNAQKSYIYPEPTSVSTDDLYTTYTFVGHENDALTLLFGESAKYKLTLTYDLKNSELSSVNTELALPPDTSYQRIQIESISPPPKEIVLDRDGNLMARYNLSPQSKLQVIAVIYVTVKPVPDYADPSSVNVDPPKKPKYVQTDSSIVSTLAQRLKSPLNVYNYIVENFTYNHDISAKTSRIGSIKAISSPSNVRSSEFTDSFIALLRSNNIHSREIIGIGYKDQDLSTLHSWPEFYDDVKKNWIAVDPTRGHTTGGINYFDKLDYSHITFVRHGHEEEYPLPAGAYVSTDTSSPVVLEVVQDFEVAEPIFSQKENVITNTGKVGIFHDKAGYIPPYGSKTIPDSSTASLYDKIKQICAKLLSIF